MSSGNYKCPLCKTTSVENPEYIWEQFKLAVESQPMPEEYLNKKCKVYCNDCHHETINDFHFFIELS